MFEEMRSALHSRLNLHLTVKVLRLLIESSEFSFSLFKSPYASSEHVIEESEKMGRKLYQFLLRSEKSLYSLKKNVCKLF